MSVQLLAVDQIITTVSADHGALRDYLLSMVYVNAAGRAAADAAGGDSPVGQFTTTWQRTLGTHGWILSQAGTTSLRSSSNQEGTALGSPLEATLGDAHAVDALSELRKLITSSPEDPLVRLWWQAATRFDGMLTAGFGRVTSAGREPSMSLDLLSLDLRTLQRPKHGLFGHAEPFTVTGPSALNDAVEPSSVAADTHSITATLNPEVFAAVREGVISQLGSKFADHYAGSPPVSA